MSTDVNKESERPFISFEEATEYLEHMCAVLRVRHLSYWSLSLSDGLPDQVTWIATYDPSYMSYYMGHYTPLGDPAFEARGQDGEIIDWAEFSAHDEAAKDIHRAAARYGIGSFGLSYPFNQGVERSIMFSVNVDCDSSSWPAEKERIMGAFCGLARVFHSRAKALVESRLISLAATAA